MKEKLLQSWSQLDLSKSKTLVLVGMWVSAALIGLLAVGYARLIALCQKTFLDLFQQYPLAVSCTGPLFFILATWLVRRWAPDAKGSGIPQVLVALQKSQKGNEPEQAWASSLISIRTATVKVISSCVGILAGASIGREGPTVQVAASGFAWIGRHVRKFAPQIGFQNFIIAGAAAGVAAAFNTPIAGITFAIEELVENSFGSFKQLTMLAIIVSGLVAQALSGDYLYFGHPEIVKVEVALLIFESITIGFLGGLLGGLFAKLLSQPEIVRVPTNWISRAVFAGLICSLLGFFTAADTSGSGYEVAERILNHGSIDQVSIGFPFYKLVTTVLSYLSGMAGGIFSPSLSIGAGVGLAMAKICGWLNFKTCALAGMVAFFSGAVRAPLTAVIIVMEMTNEHSLVLPFMIASYLAYSISRRIMPTPLYQQLAQQHLKA